MAKENFIAFALKKIRRFALLGTVFLVLLGEISAGAASYPTYIYSYEGEAVPSPDAYVPERIIDLFSEECGVMKQPQDVFAAADGRVYLADTGNRRILVLDATLKYEKTIEYFIDEQGKRQEFLAPSGIFVTEGGTLYVADTEQQRIVALNQDLTLKRAIESPSGSGISESFAFRPYSLAVDKRGRCYVISLHNTAGVMTFDENGVFTGFIGAQNTTPSLSDLFWRILMTKEQKSRLRATVPAEYSNIAMDREGFFYVTDATLDQGTLQSLINSRSKSALRSPIKKLNPSGVDVMTRSGYYPPVGDVKIPFGTGDIYGGSQIIDVAVCGNGLFSLADGKRNKIFTYDEEGNLLYAFSGTGTQNGRFQRLISLAYRNDSLLALDAQTGALTVFRMTEYGRLINQAIELYSANRFKDSAEMWSKVARFNNNFDLAYIGMGNNFYHEGNYAEAMRYFKSASEVQKYSMAMRKYREQWLESYFLLIPLILAIAVLAVRKAVVSIGKKNLAGDYGAKQGVFTRVIYAEKVLFHPFDAFYQIKNRGRGNVLSATVLLGLTVLVYLVYGFYSGYLFRYASMDSFTVLSGLSTVLVPVILWVIANWCFTCLMNGEGSFRQIYIATCYSLTPLIIMYPVATLMSNVLLLDEAAFVQMLLYVAFGWTVLLLFAGMLTIHNYMPGTNLLTCLLTLLGMMIILFVSVLFVTLIQRMFVFFLNIAKEIAFR